MLTVNLFDETFRHAECSVAGKTPRHVNYVRDRLEWDGITLFTDGHLRRPVVDEVRCPRKIGWLHEPPCLHPEDYQDILVEKFETVLTYHAPLLALPGYRFAPYGGVWLPRDEWGLRPKTHLASMLIGDKTATEGHRLRLETADALAGRVDFYGARGEPVGYGWQAKRAVLGDYAFSVVTETCRLDNLFTEWLLDCFAAGTVPVFWGCPNLGEFFDERGVLAFETADQARGIVSGLSFGLYHSLLPHVAANLKAVSEYEVTEDWIYHKVLVA